MKKNTFVLALVFFTICASFAQTTSGCSKIFISEYLDGGNLTTDKAIELYNPSNVTVDLSDYRLDIFRDGLSIPTSITLTGVIEPDSVAVFASLNLLSNQLQGRRNVTSLLLNFDGNDAIGLYEKSTSLYIDFIGEKGINPGSQG